MRIITSIDQIQTPQKGSVLAIGNFDGLHIGHQVIISTAKKLAIDNDLPLFVMTFDPAPVKVLRPELAPRILTPSNVKAPLIEKLAVDQCIIVQTDAEFLSQEAEEFVENIAVKKLKVKHIVEGETFAFGRKRRGSLENLKVLGEKYDFQAHKVPSQTQVLEENCPAIAVSSTFIRQQITACEFVQVKQCLGRFYELPGFVVRGFGRGHKIGFPTANLQLYDEDQLIPANGVYAGTVRMGETVEAAIASDEIHPAAISIGECQTFTDGQWQIEAHLLDVDLPQDALYGKHMLVGLVQHMRRQEKYNSAEELIAAIDNDCKQVRLALINKGVDA